MRCLLYLDEAENLDFYIMSCKKFLYYQPGLLTMSKGKVLIFMVILSTVLAGCQIGPGQGEEEYYLKGEILEQTPENVTVVDISNESLQDEPLISIIINQTNESDINDVNMDINKTQYESLERIFTRLPTYAESFNPNEEYELYVRVGEQLYQITLWKGRGG